MPLTNACYFSKNSYPEALKQLSQWLAEGKLQRKETIVQGGLAAAPQALADLYKGLNTGAVPCLFSFRASVLVSWKA